jgi:membrane-associated protease RseP (regulator of RpoE activity)
MNAHYPPPQTLADLVRLGLPFAASLLAILTAHEMGHFVTARMHGVDASWPYFIPAPLGVGTFGAVIRMHGRIPSRDALVDIGASGPLAGAAVAIPLLVYGIGLSDIHPSPVAPNFLFGNLSLVRLVMDWVTGHGFALFSDDPARMMMEPQPLLYVLLKKLVFHVGPLQDVNVHPVAFAAVIGLFITALNLVPIGQLDAGHVTHAVLGKRAEKVGRVFAHVLLGMALFSSFTWIVWYLLVTRFVGFEHPPVENPQAPLSTSRKVVVVLTVLLFLATLTPVAADSL